MPHHRRPPQGSAAQARGSPALPASPLPRPAGMQPGEGVFPRNREGREQPHRSPSWPNFAASIRAA
jgi:hypothetical protein